MCGGRVGRVGEDLDGSDMWTPFCPKSLFFYTMSYSPWGFDPRSLGVVGYEADAITIRPRRPTCPKNLNSSPIFISWVEN